MTSTQLPASPATRGRSRRAGWVVAVLVLLLALGGWGAHTAGFRPNLTTASVPVPDASATPEEVVSAYVTAYNSRDFSTMRAIYPTASTPRFEVLGRMENLRIVQSRAMSSAEDGNPAVPGRSYHRVGVLLDLTGLDHSNVAYRAGPNGWTYLLERDSDTSPWHIADHGNP